MNDVAVVTTTNDEVSDLALLERALDQYGVPKLNRSLLERVHEFGRNYIGYTEKEVVTLDADAIEEKAFVLSPDQEIAWEKMRVWLANRLMPIFILKGYAGTGKTFLMQKMLEETEYTVKFTAPTNKAAKVLSQTLGVTTVTIYSLLGLKMVPDEDGLQLVYPDDPPYISKRTIVVIDEASMVGSQLNEYLLKAQSEMGFRIMYVGDPAQLNPVGENTSPAWKMVKGKANTAMLRKVMRFDNQLLKLSIDIRTNMRSKNYKSPIVNDNADNQGVYLVPERDFEKHIKKLELKDFTDSKIIAWRNKTVTRYNNMVRRNLGFTQEYEVGEVLLLAAPIEEDGQIIGHTDEEGIAQSVALTKVTIDDVKIPVWAILFKTDERAHRLFIPTTDSVKLDIMLSEKATRAKNEKNKRRRAQYWDDFWRTKRRFHSVRYGYALTAHRIQGSTIDNAFIDQSDILANSNKREAFRCLYVAATRPKYRLITY